MYSVVLQTLPDKHKDDLRRDARWTEVQLRRRPLELVNLCQSVLVNRVSGLPVTEQIDSLTAK